MTRDQALEWVRIRCLLKRRIVPFLVHEEHERGGAAADIALRLGLREGDVRTYVEEVEREVRAMLEARGESEDASSRTPGEGYWY